MKRVFIGTLICSCIITFILLGCSPDVKEEALEEREQLLSIQANVLRIIKQGSVLMFFDRQAPT